MPPVPEAAGKAAPHASRIRPETKPAASSCKQSAEYTTLPQRKTSRETTAVQYKAAGHDLSETGSPAQGGSSRCRS